MTGSRRTTVAGRIAGLLALAILAGCGTSGSGLATFPSTSIGPDRTVSPAVASTRAELFRVLGERRLIVTEPEQPFRPAESLALTSAPRAVYQVQLPDDPGGGWIVVYELADPSAAATAAQEQADWLASGPGRVQTPIGTIHVLRVLGSTVIAYAWHPDDAPDPGAREIQDALESIGIAVDVPA